MKRVILFGLVLTMLLGSIFLVTPKISPSEGTSEQPITVEPAKPQQGEKLTIRYNPEHSSAQYRLITDPLYATISFNTSYSSFTERILLSPDPSANRQLVGTVRVPNDAFALSITISPGSTYFSNECAEYIVGLGDRPAKGALASRISSAATLEEAEEIFQQDKELYPESFVRHHYLWRGKIKSGFSKQEVYEEVKKVYDEIVKRKFSDDEDLRDGVFLCAVGFIQTGAYREGLDALKRTLQVHNTSKIPLTHHFQSAFVSLLDERKNVRQKDPSVDSEIADWLASFLSACPEISAANNVFRYSRRDQHSIDSNSRLAQVLSDIAGMDLGGNPADYVEIHGYSDYFFHAGHFLLERNDSRALRLLKTGVTVLDTMPDWISPRGGPVTLIPLDNFRIALKRLLADAHLQQSDTATAIRLLTEATKSKYSNHTKPPISLCHLSLAKIYLQKNDLQNAKRHWAHLTALNSPFSQEILEQIQDLQAKRNLARQDGPSIMREFKIAFNTDPSPNIVIPTSFSPLHLKGKDDTTTVLLFSIANCKVCSDNLPGVYRKLKSVKEPLRVALITNEDAKQINALYGSGVRVAQLNPELQSKFGLVGLPSVVVIKEGKIVLRTNSVNANTFVEVQKALENSQTYSQIN